MARGIPLVETCPTCGIEFIGGIHKVNGNGPWRKECPAGHSHTQVELARTRNAKRQASRHAMTGKLDAVRIKDDEEALCLALAAMIGGYDRLLITTPTQSHTIIEGAFGKSIVIAREILAAI